MLDQIYWGNSLESWGISILIIAGALVLNKIISLINKHIIQKITSKTKNRFDDILFRVLETPVLLGIALLAIWFAAARLELPPKVDKIILHAYHLLVVLNITWFVARLISALIEEFLIPASTSRSFIDANLIPLFKRSVLIVTWSIGVIMALNNAGVNVGTLIAGLGIGGLAFALAAQDTIKNIFGGFTIFTDRPFRIGDRIKVDGFDGFVEDIGIRSTRLRTLEKRLVTIPNYKIVEASVENISAEPMRRVMLKLGLTYSTSSAKMEEAISILKAIPSKVEGVTDKDLAVFFSDFGESALMITFIFFVKRGADVVQVPSNVNFEILKAFNSAGLEFAFPTQTVYLAK